MTRRQIVCQNPLCPEVVRTKRPQWLGEVLGEEAHIPCHRCRQTTHWRATDKARERVDSPAPVRIGSGA